MKPPFPLLLSLALLASCAQQSPRPESPQREAALLTHPVLLYRGLKVVAGTTNEIDWTKSSFGVSGQPSTLSLFDNILVSPHIPCWLEITVDVPGVPPPVHGVTGDLAIPNPPPGGANAGPWPVVFDNAPPGHWSIAQATIGGTSNTQASIRAAAVFSAMAQAPAPTATVVDGSANGCH